MVSKTLAGALVLVIGLGAGACGKGENRPGQASSKCAGDTGSVSGSGAPSEAPSDFPESEATTKVSVTLQDYAFVGLPATAKGPNVFFTGTVSGSSCHEVQVVDAKAKLLGEIPPFAAGETKTMALKLDPGTYTVQCLVKEGKKTHAELGMKQQLTVE
jgi:plastocyanin